MAAPTVLGIDIASGPPGTQVVLTGTNFDETITDVSFGAYSAGPNWNVISETDLTVIVPAGTGTSLNVTVTNGDGTGTLTSGWSYDSNEGGPGGGGGDIPTVTLVNPDDSSYGEGEGGDTVVITGTKFTTAIYVWFGDRQAQFTVDSDTQITATAPPNWGTVYVYVQNAYGISVDADTYNDFAYPVASAPTITAIVPASGSYGTVVTIVGTNFLTATAVYFGAYTAAFQIIATNEIRAYVPEGAGTADTEVDVTVVTEGGTTPDPGTANNFTYVPAITTLSATAGPGYVTLKWTPHLHGTPVWYEIYMNTYSPPDTKIAITGSSTFTVKVLHADGLQYFGIKWFDSYSTKSAMSNIVSCEALEVAADIINERAISAIDMFASNIRPPEVLDNLPTDFTDYPLGSLVFLTSDYRLYRNTGGPNANGSDTVNKTWYDISGNNRDTTLDGFPTPTTTSEGWAGNGTGGDPYRLVFDGTDYTTLPSGVYSMIDSVRDGTLECWFRMTSLAATSWLTILSNGSGGTHYFYLALQYTSTGNRALAGFRDSTSNVYLASQTAYDVITDGSWHHLVGTIDGTTLACYLDGVLLDTTTTGAGTFSADRGYIGCRYDQNNKFTGDLNALRYYNNALSAAEVLQNFRAGPTGVGYVSANLVAEYNAKQALETNGWMPMVDAAESSGPIVGSSITANSITAGMISAGAIGAKQLASDQVVSRQIFVGSYQNLIPNANSELSVAGYDASETSPDYDFRGSVATNPFEGSRSRRLVGVASGATEMAITRQIPVNVGEKYYCAAMMRLHSTPAGSEHGHFMLKCYKAGGTLLATLRSDAVTTTSYGTHPDNLFAVKDGSGNPYYEIPSGAGTPADAGAYLQVYMETQDLGTTNYVYADQMILRRMLGGELIVDGAITASHIEAEVSLDAPVITGGTITGASFETTPASGNKHIEISSGSGANIIKFIPALTNDTPGEVRASDNGSTHAYLEIVPPLVHDGVTPALFQMWSTSTASGLNIESDNITVGVSGGYPKITIEGGTTDHLHLSAGTAAYITLDQGTGEINFVGALKPSDYVDGTSDDGVWIQDSYASGCYKIAYNSNLHRLFVHDGGTNYYINLNTP